MKKESTSGQIRKMTKEKAILVIVLILFAVGLVYVNSIILSKMRVSLRQRRADLVYSDFLDTLKTNNFTQTSQYLSSDFQENLISTKRANGNIDFTKAESHSKISDSKAAGSMSAEQAFKALSSLPSFKSLNNPYTLYLTPNQTQKDNEKSFTARFTAVNGKQFDVESQFIKQDGKWKVKTFTVPDPTDGKM